MLCHVVPCFFMLCYVVVVLCCAMSRHVALCCAMLCYAVVPCCAMFCQVVLCWAMLCHIGLCCAMLCYVFQCSAMLCYIFFKLSQVGRVINLTIVKRVSQFELYIQWIPHFSRTSQRISSNFPLQSGINIRSSKTCKKPRTQ